jgi:hypothetical protein
MKPKFNNGFKDDPTGINFIIPCDRQVTDQEAKKLIDEFKSNERDKLFSTWKNLPANKNWHGDAEEKKNELFAKKHPPGSEQISLALPN